MFNELLKLFSKKHWEGGGAAAAVDEEIRSPDPGIVANDYTFIENLTCGLAEKLYPWFSLYR